MGLTPEKEWQSKFIKELCATGNITAACRKAKISRAAVYEARKSDHVFAAAWDEALEVAIENLELEARRRAEKGVVEHQYYLGKSIGKIRRYSDTLLIFLLKAHRPEKYRDNQHVEHSGSVGVTVKVIEGPKDVR